MVLQTVRMGLMNTTAPHLPFMPLSMMHLMTSSVTHLVVQDNSIAHLENVFISDGDAMAPLTVKITRMNPIVRPVNLNSFNVDTRESV